MESFAVILQALPIRWQAPWLLPAVLALGAALTAAVLWYYPGQVKLVRRPWRYVIPLLRLLAFTALAVSIAQPIALRARPPEGKGALIVLVDRSASMSIADGGRRPSDLVSIADALGLLPAGARAESSAAITADFEQLQAAVGQAIRAQGDLDYARVSGRGIEAAEARVHKSVEEHRALGRSLAVRLADLAGDESASAAAIRDKLRPLAELPPADLRGAWIAETRRRLEQASAAMVRFQEVADQSLYRTHGEVRAICQELEQRSRLELAVEALVRPGGLLSRLGSQTPVLLYAFDDKAVPLPPVEAAPPAATMPGAPPVAPLQGVATSIAGGTSVVTWTSSHLPIVATGTATDIPGALAQALAANEDRPLRGVLVISDGQQAGGAATAAAAALLPPGVPLITVSAAAPNAPRDLAVADVESPAAAFIGETILVRARVRGTGGLVADPAALRLSLLGNDDAASGDGSPDNPSPVAELSPTVIEPGGTKGGDGGGWAQFAVKLDRPGVAELRLSVPQGEGEVSGINNVARRFVKVLPDRIRVAAYAGSAGWDFQYLRSALGRQDWFSVESAVLNPAKPRVPLTPAQILQQDVLILFDMPDGALDREQWYAVDRLVMQGGGSVIFIAGPSFNPGSYIDQPLASSLLPFNLQAEKKPAWRQWPGDRPSIRLVPAPEFLRSDLLRLADADATNRRWQDLPGAWRVLPVRATRPGVRSILRDAETGYPVVTEMKPGVGRSFYVGTHETWRWRQKNGEAEHERFWRQFVRHAAEEPYASKSQWLSLDLDQVAVTPGESVHARVRVSPAAADPATVPVELPIGLRLEVYRQSGAVDSADPVQPQLPLPWSADESEPFRVVPVPEFSEGGGRARVTLGDLPAGRYLVRLNSLSGEPAGFAWPQVPLRVVPSLETEMKNLSGDADRLRRMAESTGGRMLRIDQLAAVPGLLAAAADQRPTVIEWSLWDSPWLFVFVVGCLGAEWALRKRAGLA